MRKTRMIEIIECLLQYIEEQNYGDKNIVGEILESLNISHEELQTLYDENEGKKNKYFNLSETADFEYLKNHLTNKELAILEGVITAYIENRIDINIVRDENQEIIWDKSFGLIVRDPAYKEIGIETVAIKWYESFEDTGYLIDCCCDLKEKTTNDELTFIFDEDILVSEGGTHLEGYVWATDTLVARLEAQEPTLTEDQTRENINFYPVYDPVNKTISMEGHYDLEDTYNVTGKAFTLPLSPDEATRLIEAFEAYCQQQERKSCLDFLNEVRQQKGLKRLSTTTLDDQIQSATAKSNDMGSSFEVKIDDLRR